MKQTVLFILLLLGLDAFPQCAFPQNINVLNTSASTSTVSWTAGADETQWEVAYFPALAPPGEGLTGELVNSTTFTLNNLQCDTNYRVHIRSICGAGQTSIWNGPFYFTSGDCNGCYPPQGLQIIGQTTSETTVTWTNGSSYPTEFLLQSTDMPSPTASVQATTSATTSPFTLSLPGCDRMNLYYRTQCGVAAPWQGPFAVHPMGEGASLGTVYGCVSESQIAYDIDDVYALLPAGDVTVYGYWTAAITDNLVFEIGPNQQLSYLYPSNSATPTFYAVVDNPDGCDSVHPIHLMPGDTCQGFRLEAFIDENANGTKDAGEIMFPKGGFTYSLNNGATSYGYTRDGNYFIVESNSANLYDFAFEVNTAYASQFSCSTTHSNVSNSAGLTVLQFPVIPANPVADASVDIIPLTLPMPGFTTYEAVVITNNGMQTIASGTLTYTKDAVIPDVLVTSQQGTITQTATGFTLDFTNLNAFETLTITVKCTVPTIPTVQLGQTLHSSVSIAAEASDINVNNNVAHVIQTIVGSYDPNDKMEAHGPQILHSSFSANDYLYYTIRFENTGTAPAHNIRIEDVLDSQLNEETVELLSSSDHCTLTRNGNSLVFNLPNVMLPPSVENTQIGHGYVQFRVKPDAGYQVNDVIPNTASIYFDFNPAIVTNEWTTTFVNQLQVDEFDVQSVAVYPNPTSDFVTVVLKNGNVKSARVYDISGKVVAQSEFSDTIDLSKTTSGMYFLEILTDSNQKFTRKLLKK